MSSGPISDEDGVLADAQHFAVPGARPTSCREPLLGDAEDRVSAKVADAEDEHLARDVVEAVGGGCR